MPEPTAAPTRPQRRAEDLPDLLDRLAPMAGELGGRSEPDYATLFRRWADRLRDPNIEVMERLDVLDKVRSYTMPHPGALTDRYFTLPSGKPDSVRSGEYRDVIEAIWAATHRARFRARLGALIHGVLAYWP